MDPLAAMGLPAYVVQHFGGAMLEYQNGHMAGADANVEKLTGRHSMTVGEFGQFHVDQLNGGRQGGLALAQSIYGVATGKVETVTPDLRRRPSAGLDIAVGRSSGPGLIYLKNSEN